MADHTQEAESAAPELLPCPFCGGTEAFVERLNYSAAYVQCDSSINEHDACLARGPIGVQEDDDEDIPGEAAAIRAWNEQAAHRAQAADTGVDGLPPLPQPMRKVYERPHGVQELLYYTAEQMRAFALHAQRAAHTAGLDAGYALAQEAIDNLKEQVGQLRAELASRGAAQGRNTSINFDTEFHRLLVEWFRCHVQGGDYSTALTALIAYIDAWGARQPSKEE